MASRKSKVVVGREALTMVRPEGSDAPTIYVYAGGPVPAGADAEDVKRLLDEGYLEEVDAPDTSAPTAEVANPDDA